MSSMDDELVPCFNALMKFIHNPENKFELWKRFYVRYAVLVRSHNALKDADPSFRLIGMPMAEDKGKDNEASGTEMLK